MEGRRALTKTDSLCLKGIAIILMIFHHCFLDQTRFEKYTVIFSPFSENFIVSISYYFKICVSIFAFISGYGLYLSAKDHLQNRREITKWTISRLVKTISGFQFVYILVFIISWVYADFPRKTYCANGNIRGGVYAFLDFLGLSSLFKTPTLNATWWYMGAAILFIVLIPSLIKLREKIGYFNIIIFIVFIPRILNVGYLGSINPYGFILALLLGMIFAEYKFFERFDTYDLVKNKYLNSILIFLFWLVIFIMSVVICDRTERYQIWELHYAIAPVVAICFCKKYILDIPVIRQILSFLGKYSMDIFLTHTFIRYTFFQDFTYSFKFFWLIALVLLTISLGISVVLGFIKKWIQFDRLIFWLSTKVTNCIDKLRIMSIDD